MRTIATAGHVDHGKSTLVRALTGIDPDRLKEEREREMTIDLGFAWMKLPNGEALGLVDVPGHIDFIENMLAGVGGIDAALIVIAADEGIMPQTREHIDILRLLHISKAVVALTKSDLAPDAEWLELVAADIRALIAGAPFADAAIVPCSARAKTGLDALVRALQACLADIPARRDVNRARLPIDRIFSMAGFGTVVTGTLLDGAFSVGDEVDILPAGLSARIRGLQTHRQKRERADPGGRLAINLSGVEVGQLRRGQVVARPGTLAPTRLLDVSLEIQRAPSAASEGRFAHNTDVKVFAGAAESVARVRLLEGDSLAAGEAAFAQLELREPLAVALGDRFIVRLPSPSITVGGGRIVDPHPAGRHRRRAGKTDAATLSRLRALLEGTPRERLENALLALGFCARPALAKAADIPNFETELAGLVAEGGAIEVDGVLGLAALWHARQTQLLDLLRAHHRAQPLQLGLSRESARTRLGLGPRDLGALVRWTVGQGLAVDDADTLRAAGHAIVFAPAQQRQVDALLAQFAAQPLNTPSPKECRAQLGDAVFEALIKLGRIRQINPDVALLRETYVDAVGRIRALIDTRGTITAAELRDALSTSRKYALALLEHLDEIGVTRRVGDARVLK
jgi:selenocysteine-specific elongation factor